MTLEHLKATVLERLPRLRKLLEEYGATSLFDYFSEERVVQERYLAKDGREAAMDARFLELLSIFRQKAEQQLGVKVAKQATQDLLRTRFVSTADHHGPLCHPFFVNSAFVQGMANKRNGLRSILVFACGNVSLNNSSFPRGLLMHNNELHDVRIPFISLKRRHCPVISAHPYDRAALAKAKITGVLELVYGRSDTLACERYADQISRTNHALWKLVPGQHDMDLLYFAQEDMAIQLLLEFHLFQDTIIHRLLFDRTARESFARNFDGITGAFSSHERKGTFLFWHIRDGVRRLLVLDNGELTTKDASYRLKLLPEAIQGALVRLELIPGMALTFILLSFYHGLRCGGGFSQINYLTEMKGAWRRTLQSLGAQGEAEFCKDIQTDIFRGEFVFAYLTRGKKHTPATLIDILLYTKNFAEAEASFTEAAYSLTLGEAIEPMMQEFYRIITGKRINHEVSIPQNAWTIEIK